MAIAAGVLRAALACEGGAKGLPELHRTHGIAQTTERPPHRRMIWMRRQANIICAARSHAVDREVGEPWPNKHASGLGM